jgi:hypothetical protein
MKRKFKTGDIVKINNPETPEATLGIILEVAKNKKDNGQYKLDVLSKGWFHTGFWWQEKHIRSASIGEILFELARKMYFSKENI